MTSQTQVGRLLSLVPYLLSHDGVRVADVARDFGITAQQLMADLKVIYMCGLPGLMPGDLIEIDMDAAEGSGVIHLTNADFLARPLRLTVDEALALILALRTVREVAGPDEVKTVDSALVKLEAAAGEQARLAERTSVQVTSASEQVREVIRQALDSGKRLDLTYDVASRAETTRRMVDPLRVFVLDGYAYLEAWCYSAKGVRAFRLDRIAAVESTKTDVAEHDVELKDLSTGWFASLADAPLVRLSLDPSSRWVAEYYPAESVFTPAGTDELLASFHVADPAWLRALLLRLGGGARVLSPKGAGVSAAEAADEALGQYEALFSSEDPVESQA